MTEIALVWDEATAREVLAAIDAAVLGESVTADEFPLAALAVCDLRYRLALAEAPVRGLGAIVQDGIDLTEHR